MATVRCVVRTIRPQTVTEGAGVRLQRVIGGSALDYLDPFLLLDHFGSHDPADYLAGFPWHPHRGIETVTYMLDGRVDHHDSIGNAGTIGRGDIQWMTAGGGIMHEEMPRPHDGRMEGFQLWVNLPAELKMTHPRYQDVSAAAIPAVRRDDGVTVRVVAGEVDGVDGAVHEIYADPSYLDVELPAGASFAHEVMVGNTAFAYLYRGTASFGEAGEAELDEWAFAPGAPAADDASAASPDAEGRPAGPVAPLLAILGDGDEVRVTAGPAGARLLLVSGRPLGEPIARYGPFVMTTRAEIEQALRDLRAGEFVWRDDAEWLAARR